MVQSQTSFQALQPLWNELLPPVGGRQLVVGHGVRCRIKAIQVAQQEAQREAQLAICVCCLQARKSRRFATLLCASSRGSAASTA